MKRIINILLLFINIIPLYAGWPVEFNYGKIISDVFWSSRGTDGWHEGIDITANSCDSPVKNINTGKLYWYRQNNNSTDYVGIGIYKDIGLAYGHLSIQANIRRGDAFSTLENILGEINHDYPHVHLEYCGFVTDTADSENWWNNRPTISDPMQYLNKTYPLNLQTPRFFWLTENDIGDVTKIGRFIKYDEDDNLSGVGALIKNGIAIIYGRIQMVIAPASFTGVWCDYESNSNTYDIATKINNNNITANSIEYPDYYSPKLSMVYKYGYRINNSDIYWQLDGDPHS